MANDINFDKDWKVLRGPYTLFSGSMIVEFLEPDSLDLSFLCRVTIPASNPLNKLGKKHPVIPPLHIHFDQAETFKVVQGKWGLTTGWDQKDTIITADDSPATVEAMVPHYPWPVPCDEDSIIYTWGHPSGVPEPMTDDFFESVFLYTSRCYEERNMPDLLQMMLSQHITRSTVVMLPSIAFLGSLRWWVPLQMQSTLAALAKRLGYTPLLPDLAKQQ